MLGWFTATEAGGMGAGMALLIALFQRRLGWKRFYEVMKETAMTSVMLYVVLFGAMMFSQLISFSGLADALLSLVQDSGLSKLGHPAGHPGGVPAAGLRDGRDGHHPDLRAAVHPHPGGAGLRPDLVRHHRGGADRDRPDHAAGGHERVRAQGQPAQGAGRHHLPRPAALRRASTWSVWPCWWPSRRSRCSWWS
jgi:hypothetical protein